MTSILRLTQTTEGDNKHRVEVAFEADGVPRLIATARFNFALTRQDQEDLRWYLEDFLQYPLDPAPKIAARIENRMNEIGTTLFNDIFQSGDDARDLWATLRERLDETRVEIITEVREAAAIPWELIRDPKTDTPLSLRAHAFVRAHSQAAHRRQLPKTDNGTIRILLVICRPGGGDDVPFRSVASRLIKGLGESARDLFQLDVLRPPTFERLAIVLREAKDGGRPYHVVHFDGHGFYADVSRRGYLLFENPAEEKSAQLVDGSSLGKLLVSTHVPVLVLNACRSARADPQTEPVTDESDEHPHAKVRAFGSLAHEVMDAGVAGVVAMRYNVYVVTAATFVAELYASLTQGHALGDSVTMGRKHLAAQPLREIAYNPLPLQDWAVPVVYEIAPIALFPRKTSTKKLALKLSEAKSTPGRGTLDARLLLVPDAGFFGRDETLLALDRAFDTQSIVVLHAYAGGGKTSTAAEFARWYSLTGGVDGPVLFTSFEHYKPLARVLDQLDQVFGRSLERAGINWSALADDQRSQIALLVLKQTPVLWIWDNVEPVAGFPAGAKSAWSALEQLELTDFLNAARETKAKFLLTSRRDERDWLGDSPARVWLLRMPMQERVQLARALAEKQGRRLIDVDDWRPLLSFTQGNPMTITVLVGQALRDGLKTREQIKAFVEKLRAGEAVFEDEASEGRSKSLGASLSYGFENAFSEQERRQIALLHLFNGFVSVDDLRLMGNTESKWCLPEVRDLSREAGIALLDRVAEVGLLFTDGGGFYSIHPALPWYLRGLFDACYPRIADAQSESTTSEYATRTFVEAIGQMGRFFFLEYEKGQRKISELLSVEEPNLLHARQLARANGWWRALLHTMQGLQALYYQTGRQRSWARLLEEIVPDFIDPKTDGPLPGREDGWSFITGYRARLAWEARHWKEAERLQRRVVDFDRQYLASGIAPADSSDIFQRQGIVVLAVSLEYLGHIQREQQNAKCVETYKEAISLCQQIGDNPREGILAFNLGNAYLTVPRLRDLAQAEYWYRRALELYNPNDWKHRAGATGQLGLVSYQRFLEAEKAKRPQAIRLRLLTDAVVFYEEDLALLHEDAVSDLAVAHGMLGLIYGNLGALDVALPHYVESIRCDEIQGDLYGAARTRSNVAVNLKEAGRFSDALQYASAALRNYQTYGEHAAQDIRETRELVEKIEREIRKRSR